MRCVAHCGRAREPPAHSGRASPGKRFGPESGPSREAVSIQAGHAARRTGFGGSEHRGELQTVLNAFASYRERTSHGVLVWSMGGGGQPPLAVDAVRDRGRNPDVGFAKKSGPG